VLDFDEAATSATARRSMGRGGSGSCPNARD
jgi:hypothetical protein